LLYWWYLLIELSIIILTKLNTFRNVSESCFVTLDRYIYYAKKKDETEQGGDNDRELLNVRLTFTR
jgi:hypothetical protein